MSFLSIDFSTDIGFMFLKVKNKTFSKALQSYKYKNDSLMKDILDFFKENNLKFNDISKIFVNQGPGNFSGLRTSLAIAKGISLSKNLKLFGYNTFVLSCSKFFNKKEFIFSIIKIKEKYFIKRFNKVLQEVSKPQEITKEDIIEKYHTKFKVIPKNLTQYFDDEILNLNNLSIVDLEYNELQFLELKGLLEKNLIKPLYLS